MAGTLVVAETGLVPIEKIEVGDRVLSRDEATGETAFKPVAELIRRHERPIWVLSLEVQITEGDSEGILFETTDDHPWRTLDGQWIATADLAPGMQIERAEGVAARVLTIERTERTEPAYNLEVADFHTYFVGEARVWVHNACDIAARRTGTYTNTHASGTRYHGKGSETRMRQSASERAAENSDPVVKSEHTPAPNAREAFIEEQRRIDSDGGPGVGNYNKINSPGKKMLEED